MAIRRRTDDDSEQFNERDLLISLVKDVKYLKEQFSLFRDEVQERFRESGTSGSDIYRRTELKCDKLEERIRMLENWRWYVIGIGCVLGSLIGLIIKLN